MPRLRARRREAQPRQPLFCVCPAGVESCPAEVQVEVEAASRLSRATWLALGGWYDLTLTTPGLAWPGPAQAGFLGSPMSAPRSETSSKAPIITGLAACRRRCLLLQVGFSCSIVDPAEVASESWDKTGKGRLVKIEGPHWKVDRSDCRWDTPTKMAHVQYRVNEVWTRTGQYRKYLDRPACTV